MLGTYNMYLIYLPYYMYLVNSLKLFYYALQKPSQKTDVRYFTFAKNLFRRICLNICQDPRGSKFRVSCEILPRYPHLSSFVLMLSKTPEWNSNREMLAINYGPTDNGLPIAPVL